MCIRDRPQINLKLENLKNAYVKFKNDHKEYYNGRKLHSQNCENLKNFIQPYNNNNSLTKYVYVAFTCTLASFATCSTITHFITYMNDLAKFYYRSSDLYCIPRK